MSPGVPCSRSKSMADFLINLLGFGIVAIAYNLVMAQVVRVYKVKRS